jgi:CheY-like chemotaxis protein
MAEDPKTVLIVEDEPLLRMFAADTLADAGYAVMEAGTAEEALHLIATGTPLVAVMTDIEMPGQIDGLELTGSSKPSGTRLRWSSSLVSAFPDPTNFPQKRFFWLSPILRIASSKPSTR